MSVNMNKVLYRLLFVFAILDLITGVMSLAINHLAMQIVALVFTATTLALSIWYCIDCKRIENKNKNIGAIIIGSLDLATSLVSVLIMVLTTQIIAIVVSGLTFVKSLKIFVQSEKARKLLSQSTPLLKHIVAKVSPVIGAGILSRINIYIKKLNNKEQIVKMKEFLKKLGAVLKANVGTISVVVVESIGAGGGAYGLAKYFESINLLPNPWSIVLAVAILLVALVGMAALTIWIGKDTIASAKVRALFALLHKLTKKLFKGENAEQANIVIENVLHEVEVMVDAVQEQVDIQKAKEEAEAEALKAQKEQERLDAEKKKEAERLAKEKEKQALEAKKAEEKRQAELLAKAQKLLAEREAEAERKAQEEKLAAQKRAEEAAAEAEARKLAEEKQKEEAALNALVEQLLREKQAQAKVAEQPTKAAEQKVEAPASKNSIKKILK